jgi:hypothetical protein
MTLALSLVRGHDRADLAKVHSAEPMECQRRDFADLADHLERRSQPGAIGFC